jgi:hypothetical protein
MPIFGVEGTLTEVGWSKALAPATQRGVVYGESDWSVSHIPGLTRVKISRGTGSAAGFVYEMPSDATLDLPKPASGGRWFLIMATYDFVGKKVTFGYIPHNTTGDTSGDLAPQFMPSSLRARPGEVWDQPLAFAWVFSGAKSIEVIDLRLDREQKPASSPVRFEYKRPGNSFDNLEPGFNTQKSSMVSFKLPFPRGNIRYFIYATVKSTANDGAGAAGNVRVVVNGNQRNDDAPYTFQPNWDQWSWTGTYLHPGGLLSIAALSATIGGQVNYAGTKIEVDWLASGGIPE